MERGRKIIGPAGIAELIETAVAECPAELFRPYRYRDPQRVDGERLAELHAIDLIECAGCRAAWPCEKHRPDGYPFLELAG